MRTRPAIASMPVFFLAITLLLGSVSAGSVTLLPTTRPSGKSAPSKPVEKPVAEKEPAGKLSERRNESATTSSSSEEISSGKALTPQVEIFVPSVVKLIAAARKSCTAQILSALSGMVSLPAEPIEGTDLNAILKLFGKVAEWPDTRVMFTTYSQDRDGRPRWALVLDWPPSDTRERIRGILQEETAARLLKGIELKPGESGRFSIELPDLILAHLIPFNGGTLVTSSLDISPPQVIFGQPREGSDRTSKMLLYCRLNMQAGDDGETGGSGLAKFAMLKDLRYGVYLDEKGFWRERLNLQWNLLVGAAIKSAVTQVKSVFDCPRDAYVNGAINVETGGTLAEELAELPTGTFGGRVRDEMAFSIVPGTGFLPLPDLYFQFNATGSRSISRSIREMIEEDSQKRRDEDTPVAWFESTVEGVTVFWKHESAGTGLMPASYRPVIFFEPRTDEQRKLGGRRLVVVNTTTSTEDAVRRWLTLKKDRKQTTPVPEGKDAHWQVIVLWKHLYGTLEPLLTILTSGSIEGRPAPDVDDLAGSLPDSKFQLKLEFAGLDVRHAGPVPLGAVFVPAVTMMSLTSTGDPNSEAQRERVACRHLRVLHHHARLFRKDYGRWPSTVAELDGYIDFAAHPHLLNLRPRDVSFVKSVASMFTARKDRKQDRETEGLDDSLYEIEIDGAEWELRIRQDEFVHYKTIAIDSTGQIHRIEKPDGRGVGRSASR